MLRGIRGATTVKSNSENEILEATKELLLAIQEKNPSLHSEDLASVIFSVTEDLNKSFPAVAARNIGWKLVPLFSTQEIPVPGSLSLCIRVLLHWNTSLKQNEIQHIYLREAVNLRPDLIQKTN